MVRGEASFPRNSSEELEALIPPVDFIAAASLFFAAAILRLKLSVSSSAVRSFGWGRLLSPLGIKRQRLQNEQRRKW